MDENEQVIIRSEAVYGARTRQALVKVTLGKENIMMSTNDAKKLAYDLLDTAHAADGDAFLMDWLRDRLDVEEQQSAVILKEFRDHRIRKNGEQ